MPLYGHAKRRIARLVAPPLMRADCLVELLIACDAGHDASTAE